MGNTTSTTNEVVLDLRTLANGMPALTSALGRVHAECASVCLEGQNHRPGVCLDVCGSDSRTFLLKWTNVTEQMRRAYADPEEATEHGATGIAILLIKELTGFKVIQRALKRTGIDYWVGKTQDSSQPLKDMARLEVSGIRKGTKSQVQTRVKKKIKQTEQSDRSKIEAHIVVVEFGTPQANVAKR